MVTTLLPGAAAIRNIGAVVPARRRIVDINPTLSVRSPSGPMSWPVHPPAWLTGMTAIDNPAARRMNREVGT
jgi:hypothetical protein